MNFAATALFCLWSVAVAAQGLAPNTTYDPAIPTLEAVIGHRPGDAITTPDEIGRYLDALAKAAPDRTRLVKYATSWEGRPLHYLIVGSQERIARLDEVKRGMQVLASGAPEADRLIAELPVVVWLMHGVHGNEISSSDAALAEAYHLLAARGSADADLTLREALVIIDPMQNPDGRQRFVTQNLLGRSLEPDPNPQSAEHDEPWPGGRVNHYLFDMNRDYFALSQRETQGRARVMLDWYPQVVVDLHEMGGNSSYYFAPPADPINPLMTDSQRKSLETVRPRQRRGVRQARLRVFRPRGLRRVLSRLRGFLARVPRRGRDDLRTGVGARAGVRARGWHDADLQGQGVTQHFTAATDDGRHRGAQPRASCCASTSSSAAARSRSGRRARANT